MCTPTVYVYLSCEVKLFFHFFLLEFVKSKTYDRNKLVTPEAVRFKNCNETETKELLRNETETFSRNVTVSLRFLPAVDRKPETLTFANWHHAKIWSNRSKIQERRQL